MRVAVLGAGSWGTTLAILLTENAHSVSLWSFREEDVARIRATRENPDFLPGITIPHAVRVTHQIQEALEGAEMVVAAVPAQYLRSVVRQVKTPLPPGILFVNVAKGIEQKSLLTMSQMLRDEIPSLPPSSIATLSGPSHAEEVSRRIPTTVVAASAEIETARRVQAAFMIPSFRVYASNDLMGVEIGGSLKNVIAIAAGIIDGANLGDNTKAAVMTRGIAEIARVGVALGAHIRNFSGLSGIGYLMVTCMSRHSRNRSVGVEIGKGRKLPDILGEMVMIAEGVATTQSAHELARKVGVETPIIDQVNKILFEQKDPLKACHDLMTRDPKGEL